MSGQTCVPLDRRRLLAGAAALAFLGAARPAVAAPSVLDVAAFGVKPNAPEDQSRLLQRAAENAAGANLPLYLPPGLYRASGLRLPSGTAITGIRGATRLIASGPGPLIAANRAERISLINLTLEGTGKPVPEQGLVSLFNVRGVRIEACDVLGSGGNGIHCVNVEGQILDSAIATPAQAAIFSRDAAGLRITGNTIRGAANNGIQVWRTEPGDDGTIITGNRIEDIAARAGGSGQNGNGINVFRAGNVMIANNRIRGCAFSAVRGNTASNLQVIGNNCTALGEVAIYSEFGFEGVIVAQNVIDGAALGVSLTNYREGGRLGVVANNLIRNVMSQRPAGTDPNDSYGIGIHAEADTTVTGNVVEGARRVGISLGWGPYLRDVTAIGNVVKGAPVGIAVSVTPGAGAAVIKDNVISGATTGAVLGFDHLRAVTGDLTREPATRYAQLTVNGNIAR